MEEKNVIKMLLCSSMVVFLSMVAAQAEPPVGRMYLEEVFVDKSIAEQMGNSKGPTLKNFLLTCSTRKACRQSYYFFGVRSVDVECCCFCDV